MTLVSIKNFTRNTSVSRFDYSEVAGAVLPGWDISLVFVGKARAKDLNVRLRGKSYIPTVLSYALGGKSGEIIICPAEAEKQAPSYGMKTADFILFLFIHGLMHLEGRAHGATMEECEQKLLARFLPVQAKAGSKARTPTNVPSHRNRNRYRHVPGKTGRG